MKTFKDIVDLWPSYRVMAEDMGVPTATVGSWKLRNKIPPHQWNKLVKVAKDRGFKGITVQLLTDITEKN